MVLLTCCVLPRNSVWHCHSPDYSPSWFSDGGMRNQLLSEQECPSLSSRISQRLIPSERTSFHNTSNTPTCLSNTNCSLLYSMSLHFNLWMDLVLTSRSPLSSKSLWIKASVKWKNVKWEKTVILYELLLSCLLMVVDVCHWLLFLLLVLNWKKKKVSCRKEMNQRKVMQREEMKEMKLQGLSGIYCF